MQGRTAVRPNGGCVGGVILMKYNPEKHHRRSIRLKGYDYSQAGGYFLTFVTKNRECLFGDVVNGEMVLTEFGKMVSVEWEKSQQIRKEIVLDEFVVMPNHLHAVVFIIGTDSSDNHVGAHGCAPLPPANEIRNCRNEIFKRAHDRAPLRADNETDNCGDAIWERAHSRAPLRYGSETEICELERHMREQRRVSLFRPPKSISSMVAGFKSIVTTHININRNTPRVPVWQRNYYEHIIRDEQELNNIREYIVTNPLRWELDIEHPRNWM